MICKRSSKNKIYPKKPTPPKTRIIRHGSGYQVFDGKTKVQPTTSLKLATKVAQNMEHRYSKDYLFWRKIRYGK